MTTLTSVLGKKTRTERAGGAPIQGAPVETNERGFMVDPSQWSPAVALTLARLQGLADWPGELTDDHWRVINYMRSYYEATHNVPSLRYTCKALGLTKRQFSRLFPGGIMTVRRVSGLPGPRRSAGERELSIARELLTRDWWQRLTT